jgi:hypothetical protein
VFHYTFVKVTKWRTISPENVIFFPVIKKRSALNPLTPELNPSVQRCLPKFFT